MSTLVGTIHRPSSGLAGRVIVRSVSGSKATVAPWPQRGRSKVTLRQVQLTPDGARLVGFVATNQHG